MSEFCMVVIAAGDAAEAERIASALVSERLAACVQEVPITSTYTWQGAVHRDPEILLLAKTTAARYEELATRVRTLHGYDVPEILRIDVAGGSGDYLAWLRETVSSAATPRQ